MAEPSLLFLIGYMGAGKTTVGRLLSGKLGYRFIDLDDLIEEREKMSIPVIFEMHGEEHFRKTEQSALYSLQKQDQIVVATGGGCAAHSDNMEWLNQHGTTIYLRCHPGVLFHRIAPTKNKRPLIAKMDDVDIMEFLLESLKKRLPFYVQAQLTVDGEKSPEEIADSIMQRIKNITNSSQD
jgi:shikimate kinase